MNKRFIRFFASIALIFSLVAFLPNQSVEAEATYKDGEYSLPVTVLQGDKNERSKTNDYIVSPAKLIVKNGKNTVQLTLKNSSWWKAFSVSTGSITTLSDSGDTRVVQFPVQDLTSPVSANLHIVVPDIDYDNKYDVRFSFGASSIPIASGEAGASGDGGNSGSESSNQGSDRKTIENPKTGDEAPIILLFVLLFGSSVFLIRRLAITR